VASTQPLGARRLTSSARAILSTWDTPAGSTKADLAEVLIYNRKLTNAELDISRRYWGQVRRAVYRFVSLPNLGATTRASQVLYQDYCFEIHVDLWGV